MLLLYLSDYRGDAFEIPSQKRQHIDFCISLNVFGGYKRCKNVYSQLRLFSLSNTTYRWIITSVIHAYLGYRGTLL